MTTLVETCAIDDDGFNVCADGYRDGSHQTARFDYLGGITYQDDHDLYVSDPFNHSIRRVTQSGYVSTAATLPSASEAPPPVWSADFAAPGGYVMRLWVDGNEEQECFYWHGILYTVRSGLRHANYLRSFLPFRIPYGFYRTGAGTQPAPPFTRPTTSLCGAYFSANYGTQRIDRSGNRFCRSVRIVNLSNVDMYSEIEYMFIPHDPTLLMGGK